MLKHIHTGPVTTGQNRSIRGTAGGGGGLGRPIPPLNVSTVSASSAATVNSNNTGPSGAVGTKHMNGGPPGRTLLSSSFITPSTGNGTGNNTGNSNNLLHNASALSGLSVALGNGAIGGVGSGGGGGGGGGGALGLAGFNHNNSTTNNNILSSTINMNKDRLGAREALTSLGLLCLGMCYPPLFVIV
uniref:Uncharacterized protein n=1 Tax=Anopheles maculatus TaxID=74869 RepID=A0A182SM54_9DIPT